MALLPYACELKVNTKLIHGRSSLDDDHCSYSDRMLALQGTESKYIIPYSRKYWRELNMAVGFQIAIANILADLGSVWDRHTYICE